MKLIFQFIAAVVAVFAISVNAMPDCTADFDASSQADIKFVKSYSDEARLLFLASIFKKHCDGLNGKLTGPEKKDLKQSRGILMCVSPGEKKGFDTVTMKWMKIGNNGHMMMSNGDESCFMTLHFEDEAAALREAT
jgi:hypothetical protein